MAKKYLINGRHVEGIRQAERHLSALYKDMCQDLGIDFGSDAPAWREDFHNWKDGLQRDGSICEAACDDLSPIGERFS